LSKSNKVYLIYVGLGLIPLILILFLDIDSKATSHTEDGLLHGFTHFFQYPLYMGFALVGFLCFKLNQNRILFSVMLLLGISFLLFNPLALQPLGIGVKGLYYVTAMSFPLTLAIMFSIRETRPMDLPNIGRLAMSLIPILVLGYLLSRDVSLFSKIAFLKIIPGLNPKNGFLLPQLALASLAILGVVIFLQKDRFVKPFLRVLGITMISLMAGLWAGIALYSEILNKPEINALYKLIKRSAGDRKDFQSAFSIEVANSFPSLQIVAAFTVICAILLHAIFRAYWHRVYVDELTDIPNRRALDERLSSLSGEYAIAMMDIDHFKAFNDNYGHDEGDNVLRLVGSVLSEEFGDKVYRYGGEEFCAVFMGVSAEDAYMYANKVRRKLEERVFYIRKPNSKREPTSSFDRRRTKKNNGKKIQITISIGLANPNKKSKTAVDVVKLADQALYEAKRKGRNRVIIWEIEGVKSAV
jgi:diguanylate cyclase (GGDEF)-like protein